MIWSPTLSIRSSCCCCCCRIGISDGVAVCLEGLQGCLHVAISEPTLHLALFLQTQLLPDRSELLVECECNSVDARAIGLGEHERGARGLLLPLRGTETLREGEQLHVFGKLALAVIVIEGWVAVEKRWVEGGRGNRVATCKSRRRKDQVRVRSRRRRR